MKKFFKEHQIRVDKALKKHLPSINKAPRELHKAMHYAVFGGKRVRSILIYAVGEELGAHKRVLDDVCAAIELLHAFSLIHDDLPSLDNDDLRRGKPSCHKAFGEATAILAGDAMHTLAFHILAHLNSKLLSPDINIKMIYLITHALGSEGMVGGEEMDIKMVGKKVSLKQIEEMYKLKTGCFITACLLVGALSANCKDKKTLKLLTKFGDYIGIAFQIHDDIVGIESSSQVSGKKQGADIIRNKPVYPVISGMVKAKQREKFLFRKAFACLDKMNIDATILRQLATFIIERDH